MSDKLALSSALSVLMMASYVLFGAEGSADQAEVSAKLTIPAQIAAPSLPTAPVWLPIWR